ncbi:MAG: hypothetical protein ACYS9X_01265 [Planctomycetota bacterium]
MRAKTGLLLLVGACVLSAGCRTTLEGSVWLPDFSSLQAAGGDALDLDNQLAVETDEQVYVFDLVGDAGRNRGRIDYWIISGKGTTDAHGGFLFDSANYPSGDTIKTEMDLESIGVLWEPALIKMDGFRLRVAIGLDLLRFQMKVDDLDVPGLSGVVKVPGPDSPFDLSHMPVPKVGIGFEADLSAWMRLRARAQMFDASYLELDDDFDGTFMTVVAGLEFGRHRGIRGMVGYRLFKADYDYEGDLGDSKLEGLTVSASVRF